MIQNSGSSGGTTGIGTGSNDSGSGSSGGTTGIGTGSMIQVKVQVQAAVAAQLA